MANALKTLRYICREQGLGMWRLLQVKHVFLGLDACMLSSETFISEFVPAVHLNKILTNCSINNELSGKHKLKPKHQACS